MDHSVLEWKKGKLENQTEPQWNIRNLLSNRLNEINGLKPITSNFLNSIIIVFNQNSY